MPVLLLLLTLHLVLGVLLISILLHVSLHLSLSHGPQLVLLLLSLLVQELGELQPLLIIHPTHALYSSFIVTCFVAFQVLVSIYFLPSA